MSYKNDLETFNKTGLYLWKVISAAEVESHADGLEMSLSDDDFERVCAFVYDWVMNSEASASDVADAVLTGLHDGEITIDDFTKRYSDYETIAEHYVNRCF